jgi:transposase, IS30 family
MSKSYHQLTHEQRCQIAILKERGDGFAAIAKILGVHRSTIGREVRRNSEEKKYSSSQAHQKTTRRRVSSSGKMTSSVIAIINEKLLLQWSPEQISGWLKFQGMEAVSHETIYKYIWNDKRSGGSLYRQLRHSGKKYNKRSKGTAGRGCIPNRVDIDQRPAIVEKKSRIGDWELDSIIGAEHSGAVVSMVERASKLTKLAKVSRKTSTEVGSAVIDKLKPLAPFVYTLTSDNGKEFAGHEKISCSLGADFYFATPYHSWERGLNEHTNGLVRQYFPKETKFSEVSQEELDRVEGLLNQRPRKILGFKTPEEVFYGQRH